jgi:hypothetical protein
MPTPKASSPPPALIEYDHPAAPQIGQWLRQNVLIKDEETGPCVKLKVIHFSVNKKPQGDVGQIKVDVSLAESDTGYIDSLIRDVINRAQADANNLHSGVQLYAVFAYYARSGANYTPRCYFRVSAEEEYDPEVAGGDPSEPPNATGLVSQLMRHVEAVQRSAQMGNAYIIQSLQADNASQRNLIQAMQQQTIDFMSLIQESLDNSAQRRNEERATETKQQMLEGVFEQLKLIVPIIMNKLAGQKITPETDPSFTLLASLFESLSQEQQQHLITNFLNPAQAAVFAEFLDTYEKRKRKLTSDTAPGASLNLRKLFEKPSARQIESHQSSDPKINNMERKAKSFADAFEGLKTFKGPIRPAKL